MKRLPARFYRLDSGREPVREWLKQLDPEDRKIIGEDVKGCRIFVADRHASCPSVERGPLGSSQQPAERPHRSDPLHGRTWVHGATARIRQKIAANARAGFTTSASSKEGNWQMKKRNVGSSFDSWLKEEGIHEESTSSAIKRVLARQVAAAMRRENVSKTEMARRMHTSRAALDRLLDPTHDSVTLATLQRAAEAVGREIRLELV